MKEIPSNKLNSYFIPDIEPLSLTGQSLSAPPDRDAYYSLGADSTIPFVSLQGGGNNQKVFSWGESIKVDKGTTVKVKSESYMRGDIQINSGLDPDVRPARISVPVALELLSFEIEATEFFYYKSTFPADTRMCRRAYINLQLYSVEIASSVVIFGKAKKHSFPSQENISPLISIGNVNYSTGTTFPPNTSISQVPLGYGLGGVYDPALPMALTDQCEFIIGYWPQGQLDDDVTLNTLVMYVIEY